MFVVAVFAIVIITMAIIYSEPMGDEWNDDPWSSDK